MSSSGDNNEARDKAARSLIAAYRHASNGSQSELEAIKALGRTGSSVAAEYLHEVWRAAPRGSDREKEAIKALGEIGKAP